MAAARVARTCSDEVCTELLVRGDQIGFVSVEQARKIGCNESECKEHLDESAMPSDIKLPASFVLVHDTEGTLLSRCDFYVVRWKGARADNPEDLPKAVRKYFGNEARIQAGSVDIPEGPWKKVCKVAFIRYRRPGFEKGFSHGYDPAVTLYVTKKPLAWKLALPEGCVVTERGFIKP